MGVISKSAQAILEEELGAYRKKLIDRASLYAEHDGDLFVGDKQIKLAIRDNETSELGRIRYAEKKQKTVRITFFMWVLLLLSLIWLSICVIYLNKDSYDQIVLLIGSISSGLSIASVLMLMTATGKKSNKSQYETIIAFLEEWNEFESLLKYSYKGPNKGGNVPLTDLIDYYLKNISDNKEGDNRRIVNVLRIRNSLVHRGIHRFDEKILLRQIAELQDLIKKMKG